MDKCRYAGDLSQKDAPELLQAYPEDEPNLEDETLEGSHVADNPNTAGTLQNGRACKQTDRSGCPKSGDQRMKLQGKQNLNNIAPYRPRTHRYGLRVR